MYHLGISCIKFTSILFSKTRIKHFYLDKSKRFGFEVSFLFFLAIFLKLFLWKTPFMILYSELSSS